MAGIFTATVKYKQTVITDVEFVVLDGKGQALLGRDTALRLGVSQIVSSVSEAVNTDNRTVFDKYPDCFKGVGKLVSTGNTDRSRRGSCDSAYEKDAL